MKSDLAVILAYASEVGDCLEWPCRANAQPQVRIDKALPARPGQKQIHPFLVRRAIWETIKESAVPCGCVVWSKCFNLRCVLPEHLRCTPKRVLIKASEKAGRRVLNPAQRARVVAARRSQPDIKLSEEIAAEIRASDESTAVLAARYGVARSHINRMRKGLYWAPTVSGFSVFTALRT